MLDKNKPPDDILDELRTEEKTLELELELANCYRDSLRSIDHELAVKSIPLHFEDKDRTIYYLYLTTHDPDGALAMNGILEEAGYQEHELRWRLKEAKRQKGGQIQMFDCPPPEAPKKEKPTKEDIAKHIRQLLGGQRLTRKEIYRVLADDSYLANEINNALSYMRQHKLADYPGDLHNSTLIHIF